MSGSLDPIIYAIPLDAVAPWQSATLTGMAGIELFPTFQGTGDGTFSVDFGPFYDPITHQPTIPLPSVPAGYAAPFAGWITQSGGTPVIDTFQGSGAAVGNILTFETVPGWAQCSNAGWSNGTFGFILTQGNIDIFATWMGGGAGIQNVDMNFWTSSATASALDPKGGGNIKFQRGETPLYSPVMQAVGNVSAPQGPTWLQNQRQLIFIAMAPSLSLATFLPEELIPVALPCMPCCPIDPCINGLQWPSGKESG